MRIVNVFVLLLVLTFCLISESTANVYRVPGDFNTIGDALSRASGMNDSVIVADGDYRGDDNTGLSFRRTRITLISENGPANCIINGLGEENTGITMESSCELSGFTFQRFAANAIVINGKDDFNINNCLIERNTNDDSTRSAVRITGDCDRGIIKYCTFRNNSTPYGGAMSIVNNAEITLESCWFLNNSADNEGGAIYISIGGDADIFNCLFTGNEAYLNGGAIAATLAGVTINIDFTNFLSNSAEMNWGGAIYKDGSPQINVHNCILWDNTADYGTQIATRDDPERLRLDLTHCIVEDGDGDGQNGNWLGEDMILEQVRYERGQRDPLWGPDNYFQRAESVSLDAGSDTAEELGMLNFTTRVDLAPDEGVADIGYHYDLDLFPPIGILVGTVINVADSSLMQGVDITTSLDQWARTTPDGGWIIPGALAEVPFSITASFPGFNDSTFHDVVLPLEERLEINFGLLHPEFEVSTDRLVAASELGDSGSVDFSISNNGNGPLEWNTKLELAGDSNVEPWTPLETFDVGARLDEGIGGVAFALDHYWINTAYGDTVNMLFVMDTEGAFVDSFPQTETERSRTGCYDIAFDGENFWTVESDSVYCFSPEGERISGFEADSRPTRCITWDPDQELLWLGYSTTPIHGYDRDGNHVTELNRLGARFRDLNYWPDDPDGYCLYMTARRSNADPTRVIKMNTTTNDTMLVHRIQYEVGNPAAGYISSEMDPYSVNYMLIAEASGNNGGDRIEVLTMASNTSWMMLDSTAGSIAPDGVTPLTLTLFNERFPYGDYLGMLTIYHNAEGMEVELPISYSVGDVPWTDPFIPNTTTIESTYPNPFNATTSINYSLAAPGWMTMTIYDLAGREIDVIMDDFQVAGNYHLNVNAAEWSTGVYLAKLQSGNSVRIAKLVCVK
ncbi:MAG: T9SS type A sorting domain-containing protein [Calditrichaeota bacterium]|nr:T9SS type A sorting domain-containing protein [Calditrichota bacterium]